MSSRSSRPSFGKPDLWLRLIVLALFLGLAAYGSWQRQRNRSTSIPADSRLKTSTERVPAEPTHDNDTLSNPSRPRSNRTVIRQQTIRDEDGHVAFRGDIDVGPTLDRIRREERLSFAHDGAIFQNRERRLPQKPAGYYHEFVHPTPNVNGPGPQRIIAGREGEIFYTPNHYRTFQRLDE